MRIPPSPGLDLTEFNTAHEFWEQDFFSTLPQTNEGYRFQGVQTLNGLPWAPEREDFYSNKLGDEAEHARPERLVPWEAQTGDQDLDVSPSDKPPKLERYIPKDELPEDLLVLDPKNILTLRNRSSKPSSTASSTSRGMYRYRRVLPSIASSSKTMPGPETPLAENLAELDLSDAEFLGSGDHGHVCVSALKLSKPARVYRVACKVSYASPDDREMIYDEARTYSNLPCEFQEDWTGYHYLPEAEFDDGDGIFPACAVAPRFYGFYLPVYDWGGHDPKLSRRRLAAAGNYSPVLLLEHCGKRINPAKLTPEQRTCCYAFAARMHHAGFLHNSFHKRNILMQPGPLHLPPSERLLSTPSFRLIDFGRTEYIGKDKRWKHLVRSGSKWDSTQNADYDGRDTDTEPETEPEEELEGESKVGEGKEKREKDKEWRRIKEDLRLERMDAMNALYGWVEKRSLLIEYQGIRRRVGFYQRFYD